MISNIDQLPEGGMGLKIIWQIADELSYTRTSTDQNCLLIVKNYEQPKPPIPFENRKKRILTKVSRCWYSFKKVVSKTDRKLTSATPLQQIYLKVTTDLNALNQILESFDGLENLQIPQEVWLQCKLALAEGFTNAVRHAHKNFPVETPLEVEVKVFKQRLEIRIFDYGEPFDLQAKLRDFE